MLTLFKRTIGLVNWHSRQEEPESYLKTLPSELIKLLFDLLEEAPLAEVATINPTLDSRAKEAWRKRLNRYFPAAKYMYKPIYEQNPYQLYKFNKEEFIEEKDPTISWEMYKAAMEGNLQEMMRSSLSSEKKKYLCKVALRAGHLEKIKESHTPESTSVLSELKTNEEFFSSTLQAVALQNDISSVRSLLTIMVNNNINYNLSAQEIFSSCALLGHLEMLRLLLAYFKDEIEASMRGPIKYAALGGHVHVLEFLFKSRTDKPNKKETLTLLNCASSRNNLEAVRWLLDRYGNTLIDKEEVLMWLAYISTGELYPCEGDSKRERFYYTLYNFQKEWEAQEYDATTTSSTLTRPDISAYSEFIQHFQFDYLPKWLHLHQPDSSKHLKSKYAVLGTFEEATQYLKQAMDMRSEIVAIFLQYFLSQNVEFRMSCKDVILPNATKMGWKNIQNILASEDNECTFSKKYPTI